MSGVAIVAASAVSPVGVEWRGLSAAIGERRARPTASRALAGSHPGTLAFEVGDLPVAALPGDRKHQRLMSRPARLAAVAAHRCLAEARWDDEREGLGYFMGVGGANGEVSDLEAIARASVTDRRLSMERLGREGLSAANPLATFHILTNFTLCHSAILEGIGGPNAALFSRGAGTVAALSEAAFAIREGACSRALAGAADCAVHAVVWAKLLGEGWGPEGPAPAEGAAMVALAEHAARPLAWLEACYVLDGGAGIEARVERLLAERPTVIVSAVHRPRDAAWLGAAARRCGARYLDLVQALGDALAAAPMLAVVAAVDALQAREAATAVVVSLGLDGQLGIVRLRRRPALAPAPRASRVEPAVITGVGVVSAFGVGTTALFDGLAQGRSAVGPIRSFDATHSPVRVAGEVVGAAPDPTWLRDQLGDLAAEPPGLLESWHRDGMLRDRKATFAVIAAAEAWRMAGCSEAERDAASCLALGLEQSFAEDFARLFDGARFEWELCATLPRERLRSTVDLGARCVRQLLGLRGPWLVNGSACAAGAMAVALAAASIERGQASVVLCGGADSMVNPLSIGGFWSLGAPSPRAAPDACRPFDVRRDGLVIGEGAAVFVVEAEGRARARGARPLARVLGWGTTQDAYRVSAPRPDGLAAERAMRVALARAKLPASAIGWINAHGTGTLLNDPAECRAIRALFGAPPPVSSIKGAVGHLMAASGAIELASSLLAFERDVLPGTAHLCDRDPECDVDVIGPAPRAARVDAVLSNSFGFGGQNAAVVLGRP